MGLNVFAAGLGVERVLDRQKERDDKERQDQREARDAELQDARMDQYRQAKKDREALAEAGKPVVVNANAATLDTSGKPVVYEDPGVASSDFRQARNMAEQTGVPMAGSAPQQTITAGGQSFGSDMAGAQAAADAGNSPAGFAKRTAAALYGLGKPVEAMQLEAGAKQGKLADYTLNKAAIEDKALKANDLINQRVQANGGDVFKAATQILTETGVGGLEGIDVVPRVSPDGKTMQYIGIGRGKEVPLMQFSNDAAGQAKALQAIMSAPLEKRVAWFDEQAKTAKADKRADHKETRDDADSAAKNNYYNSLSGKNDAIANGEIGPGARGAGKSAYERMPEDLRLQYQGYVKAAEKSRDDVRKLEISNNGELTGAALATADRYKKEAAGYELKANALMGQYRTQDAPADQLGFRKPQVQGPTGPTNKAESGMARAVTLSPAELANEKRLESSPEMLTAIDREIDKTRNPDTLRILKEERAKVVSRINAASQEQGAPAVETKQNPEPATDTAPAVKSDLPPQAEAAGVALDQARAALKAISQQARPGLAAGRAAMDAYAEKLKAAKAEVAKRQADYERAIPVQGVAFTTQK